MTTATETAATMIETSITLAQAGFAGRCAKYRIAYAVAGCGWSPDMDARSAAFRRAQQRGLADVRYERGASARDYYGKAWPRLAVEAVAAKMEQHTGLAGMVEM